MTVIVGAARTPIGKFGGALSTVRAVELGGHAIGAAVERSGIDPSSVDEVLMGHVLQAGEGQITALQAATRGGLPMTVPSTTINKVCLSGLAAIGLADRAIRLGDAGTVVAGGMESMSSAPYVVPSARWGARLGDTELVAAAARRRLRPRRARRLPVVTLDGRHPGAGGGSQRDRRRQSCRSRR